MAQDDEGEIANLRTWRWLATSAKQSSSEMTN